jgi:hypothetical protein
MPLGIELAGAWVDVLSVAEIDIEISRSLDFLESESGGISDRHRSIRAVFEYSWAMLSSEERTMFAALSIFRGGFTRESAETVAGASIRNLANLTNKSLLVFDRDAGRYAVHELLRQYAESELGKDAGSADSVAVAHTGYYADLAASAAETIESAEMHALQLMEGDLDNVRYAWRRALAEADASNAARFVEALWFLYEVRGWHQAGADLLGEGAAALSEDSADESMMRAWALAAATQGWFLSHLGQASDAVGQIERAVDILRLLEDPKAFLLANQCYYAALTYLSRWEDLSRIGAEGAEYAFAIGDELAGANSLVWGAFGDLRFRPLEVAREKLEKGDSVLAAAGEHRTRTWTVFGIALIDGMTGRHDEEIARMREVVRLAKNLGYPRGIQAGLQYLGEALVKARDPAASEPVFLESLAMSEDMGQSLEMAGTLTHIASAYAQTGKETGAIELLASVLADPSAEKAQLAEETTIGDTARELLDQLRGLVDVESFEEARLSGSSVSVQVAAKQLLADS